MIKMIFMLKRRADISAAQFRHHYEAVHVPMALAHIGHLLRGYRRNYPTFTALTRNTSGAEPDFDYDAIAEMWVDDEAAVAEVDRIFNDPRIKPLLSADEALFLRPEETLLLVCDESVSVLGG